MNISLDDSADDQGFEAQQSVVESLISPLIEKQIDFQNVRPVDFQPRYICSGGVMKKLLDEVDDGFQECPTVLVNEVPSPRRSRKNKKPQQLPTCFQHYIQSGKYKQVYRRSKRTEEENLFNEDFGHRELKLYNLASYCQSDYSVLKPACSSPQVQQDHLVFDSKFQSGNLSCVFRSLDFPNQYDLFMQNDTNTKGYNQWFYFSVRGMRKGVVYTFNIVNFRKKNSFFKNRMLPAVYSIKTHSRDGTGWVRQGSNLTYGRSGFAFKNCHSSHAYTLGIELQTQQPDDTFLVATVPPYSYSRLTRFLRRTEQEFSDDANVTLELTPFCHTISNNCIPLVTISLKNELEESKRIICMVARQHPGEVWPSYLAEELIRAIPSRLDLLQKYTFKIFPMINVDGVIYGNSRCDLSGDDLNRQWSQPSSQLHPHIYKIREYIQSIASKIDVFIDLHGHSKKLNTFSYCCKVQDQYSCRILPLILSKLNPNFKIFDCTFGIDRSKINTLRTFVHKETGSINVMTLQTSLYGSSSGTGVKCYQPTDMKCLAVNLVEALRVILAGASVQGITLSMLQKEVRTRLSQFLMYDRQNQGDSGSDSDPYVDQLSLFQRMKRILPKNIQLQKVNKSIRSKKPPKKDSKRNKTAAKNEEDIFHMNLRSTIHFSTAKANKQNSYQDLTMSHNSSKKQIKVFIPRVAYLDQASLRRERLGKEPIITDFEGLMVSQTPYGIQKKVRPLMKMSKVAMLEEDTQPILPVNSLLLGMIPDKNDKFRRTQRWTRQLSKPCQSRPTTTFHRLLSRQTRISSDRNVRENLRYSEDI